MLISIIAYTYWLRVLKFRAFTQCHLRLELADGRVLHLADRPSTRPGTRPGTLANGRNFPQAYYFEAGRTAIAYGPAEWRSFYWDKQAGLLRLEAADGEVFELVLAVQNG